MVGYPDNFTMSMPAREAVYLPAVQKGYAAVATQKVDSLRALPADFSLQDLEFWSGKSRLWNHKALLHSIGGYSIGTETRGSLFSRGPNNFVIVGDSGGYQIGKGSLVGVDGLRKGMAGDEAVAAWKDNYDAKCWMIGWLDHYCDWAMTLDLPLWAMEEKGSDSPFHKCTEAQLLAMTNENLKLIDEERGQRTKWLNVVQGGTEGSIRRWWDGVKWFRRGGWSLAGNAGRTGGIGAVLETVLMMRDEDAFAPGQDWLHSLGVSTAVWSVLLTAIQQQLRELNPRLQISYDSATPFILGGRYDEYAVAPVLGTDLKGWHIKSVQLEGLKTYSDPSSPVKFPGASPLGDRLMMHHLVVDDADFSARRLDHLSNLMLMNHNMWVYLEAARRANEAAFTGGKREIPPPLATAIDVIGEAFAAADWASVLEKHRPLLDSVAGPS